MTKLEIAQANLLVGGKLPWHNEDGEQEVELVRLEQPGPVPVQDAPKHTAVTHRQVNSEDEEKYIFLLCKEKQDKPYQ